MDALGERAMRIVCFGDSNTYGFDPVTGGRFPKNVRWPGVLAGLLGPGYTVVEEGLCGRTAVFEDPEGPGLCGLAQIRSILLHHAPIHLLILMLGTNDLQARFGATAQVVANGVQRLGQRAEALPCWDSGKPQILLVAPPRVLPCYTRGGFWWMMGPGCCEKSAALPEQYAAVARQNNWAFLNASDFVQPCNLDGLHLDGESHQKLAHAVAEKVRGLG